MIRTELGHSNFNFNRGGGGGTWIFFWRGVRPKFWNPYPYLRIFLPQKRLIWLFFFFFLQIGTHFSTSKTADFTSFCNFCENGSSSKDVWPKWNPCLRILGEKVTHLGGISPNALTFEYPTPPPRILTITLCTKMVRGITRLRAWGSLPYVRSSAPHKLELCTWVYSKPDWTPYEISVPQQGADPGGAMGPPPSSAQKKKKRGEKGKRKKRKRKRERERET